FPFSIESQACNNFVLTKAYPKEKLTIILFRSYMTFFDHDIDAYIFSYLYNQKNIASPSKKNVL
ncbi:hypothetical protein, partial [Abyssisolibacter fermentans]|uniref:hypothetical protein n=1 Tax=Abyssisolibacter fermentans TaxID=1766203 RepID=UPI001A9A49D4